MAQTLAACLMQVGADRRYVGADLRRVDLRTWTMEFLVLLGGPIQTIEVRAWGVEDWALAPDHLLLEGANRLELVESDPKLERAYLESLDCEGCREDYPERVIMLRNGNCWVVAEEFYVTVLSTEDPFGSRTVL